MKKTILITLFFIVSTTIYSQGLFNKSSVKTSYSEYNFLSEKMQNLDNVEMMPGYKLEPLYENTTGDFNYVYQLFIHEETQEVRAISIKLTKIKKKKDKVVYACLPFNNVELLNKFSNKTASLGISMVLGFEAINKLMISYLLDEKFNTNRKSPKKN